MATTLLSYFFEADGRRLQTQVQIKSPSLINERWAFYLDLRLQSATIRFEKVRE